MKRTEAQLMFWLELDELSHLSLAHYFELIGQHDSAQHFNVKISAQLGSAQLGSVHQITDWLQLAF